MENTHQMCVYLRYESLSQHTVVSGKEMKFIHILCIHFYKHKIVNITVYENSISVNKDFNSSTSYNLLTSHLETS